MEERETIVSVITAQGKSAVNVIRLSGADAFSMAEKLCGGENLEHRRIYVKDLSWMGKLLDKAILSAFRSPNSYTGEDVVEISVHGGRISAERIVKALIGMGCRQAERGEFTKRAFLNGKMTLIEAESVLTRINAVSEETFDFASERAVKEFERKIESLKSELRDIKAYLQSSIDFPDDVEYSKKRSEEMILKAREIAEEIRKSSKRGISGENRPLMVIAGKTNTGKSTLFNLLLESERAIVSHEEGTTRDIISEWAMINGHYVKVMDTAGMRTPESYAERRGQEMVAERISGADLVLYIYELSFGISDEERAVAKSLCRNVIICASKRDASQAECPDIAVSSFTGEGIGRLKEAIVESLSLCERAEVSVNERQMNLIERICAGIDLMLRDDAGRESEILDERIGELLRDSRELTGDVSSEETLDRIFSKFCIGK